MMCNKGSLSALLPQSPPTAQTDSLATKVYAAAAAKQTQSCVSAVQHACLWSPELEAMAQVSFRFHKV